MDVIDTTLQARMPGSAQRHDALREQAQALEAFLFAEMLRASGTATPSPTGPSESQFDSFLRQAQSEAVAASGQTGLAEAIYRSMLGRAGLSGN
ncbi:rod-binding protein [Jannaschia donghaensis]|uniref:Rod binding protein n=1 Tax=Jannaschia donghaensis TaxID=420998 RepID=A0A0M6YGP8_9RHOB|nr:rod-binding protein [Jannaschia donghaensis]CTQ49528.1 Rod binding protein [Jannaschia donghaensis]